MKNKIVVITICVLLLIICLIVSIPNPKKARYQEHLERKNSKEKNRNR